MQNKKCIKDACGMLSACIVAFLLCASTGYGADESKRIFSPRWSLGTGDEVDADSLRKFERRASYVDIQLSPESIELETPGAINLPLSANKSIDVELVDRQLTADGMIVWSGRSLIPSLFQTENHIDTTVVLNPQTGEFGATLALANRIISINPAHRPGLYRISEIGGLNLDNDFVLNTDENLTDVMRDPEVPGGETDRNGVHIVDLFVGFSNAAARGIDPDLVGNQMAAEVNNGLRNSEVTNIKVRYVGAGFTDDDRGVVTSWLNDAVIDEHFGDEIGRLKPDLVAVVQTYDSGNSTAAGWGQAPGTLSVNAIDGIIPISRHEIGHNAGSIHCPTGDGYNFGWEVRRGVGTHMCGNQLNFYSNPFVFDASGNPMGDVNNANMAQVWRDRADVMSGFRRHSIPFADEGESLLSIVDLTVDESVGSAAVTLKLMPISNAEVSATVFTRTDTATPGQDYYGTTERIVFAAGESEKTFRFNVIDDFQVETDEKVAVLLRELDGARSDDDMGHVTITDNDDGEFPLLSIQDVDVNESTAFVSVSVKLEPASTTSTEVTVYTRPDGSAEPAADYYGFTERLVFAAGETSKSIALSIVNDNDTEDNENLSLRLTEPIGAGISDGEATVRITDDD